MLMIDRVELHMVDEVFNVRDFDYGNTFRFEHNRDPFDEPVEIGDMRQHVVGMDHIRAAVLLGETVCQVLTKEFRDSGDAALARNLSNVARRFNTKNRNTLLVIILQEISVVACKLHNQVIRTETTTVD